MRIARGQTGKKRLDVGPARWQLIRGKMKLLNNVTDGRRELAGGITNTAW